MRVLLFSMPDTMPWTTSTMSRWPNLGLCSLAANAPSHEIVVADLCCRRKNVAAGVHEAMKAVEPDLVGLSAMTFQYHTAKNVARIVREDYPGVKVVLGGYHATLLFRELGEGPDAPLFDFLVRGEGERTFRLLLDTLDSRRTPTGVRGISHRENGRFVHNEPAGLLDLRKVEMPARTNRLWQSYGDIFWRTEMVETSRGCTLRCNFCSMQGMYGRTYREYPMPRVIEDIRRARKLGANVIGFVDDNITLKPGRLETLCEEIVRAGCNDVKYFIQASSRGIASSPRVAEKMARAGFKIVFLGVENVSPKNLAFMHKGQIGQASRKAIDYLHDNDIVVIGGIIIGQPDDDVEDVAMNYGFLAAQGVEYYLDQILVPYPATELRAELLRRNLVTNPSDFRYYSGYWANVRTRRLSTNELQFLRWRYHSKHSAINRQDSRALKKLMPLASLLRSTVFFPFTRFRRSLKYGHMSELDVYHYQIDRTWWRNQFFFDLPPSRHLDVGHRHAPEEFGIRRGR